MRLRSGRQYGGYSTEVDLQRRSMFMPFAYLVGASAVSYLSSYLGSKTVQYLPDTVKLVGGPAPKHADITGEVMTKVSKTVCKTDRAGKFEEDCYDPVIYTNKKNRKRYKKKKNRTVKLINDC